MKKLLFIFVLLILSNICALGITPARTTLNFEEGMQKNIPFKVLNSESKDLDVSISVRGKLAQYVTLSDTSAHFSSNEKEKEFYYTFNLPENLDEPGTHEAEILVVEEKNIDDEVVGTQISETVGVITQLHIYVPYPDKYVESNLKVVDSGGTTNFLVPVLNKGSLDIDNLNVVIEIYSLEGDLVDSIESDEKSLGVRQRTEFQLSWESDVVPATYNAVAKIYYDGNFQEKEIEFNVGELALEVLEINVNGFELGEVAKFEALVQNNWGDDLKNVFLNILVYDEGKTIADFRSQNYDINALDKINMIAYWDTAEISEGTYDASLVLRFGDYGEKSIENKVQFEIGKYELKVLGLTGHVVDEDSGRFNLVNILILFIVLLVIGNIVWFIKYKFKKKK